MSDIRHLGDLTPDPQNARRHNPRNVGMIERSLGEVGAGRSIVIDEQGRVLAGNATIEAAAAAGIERVVVVDASGDEIIAVRRSNLTPEQKTRLALYDNRAAELAEWDAEVLAAIASSGVDVGALWSPDEWAQVVPPADVAPGAGGDEFDTTPDDGPTRAQSGDLWLIDGGRHRLIVGDCTDPAVVARLMGGERAGAVVTDPPYGVEFRGNGWDKSIPNWLGSAQVIADTIVFTTGPTTLWEYPQPDWVGCWYREASNARAIWGGFSHWSPIVMYGSVSFPVDSIKLHAIQHATSPDIDHPSPKPVALMEWLIENSANGDLVADPFLGSGTTLIAAHRTGRRCYGCEIEPRYADVILRRCEAEGLRVELTNG